MTRAHALLVTCVCTAILFLGLAASHGNWPPVDWPGAPNQPDEDAIDAALQEAATAALGQREGTIIVMDPQTGRVRAVVNPQVAYAQALMPGSTMKPFAALAGLRAGLIDANSRTVCPGRFNGLNFSLACVHEDHLPPFTPAQAIAYSCNYYFATLGEGLGRDQLVETLRPFGFGQPTGVMREEVAGTVRPCESANSTRIRSSQSDCDARAAIGESDHIQVSPIQLLTAFTTLVNGGHLFRPAAQGANDFQSIERGRVAIAPEHRAIVIEGMRGAVRYGTARTARLDSLPVYVIGKTGTSLPPKGFRSNGWFVGLAGQPHKSDSPATELNPSEIHLAVLVLLTRSHGAEAAGVSKSIFQTYADAANPKDTEPRRSGETVNKVAASPRLRVPASSDAVRVHLVRDHLTQELSLEDYVLGVMRAEGSMETEGEALKALAIAIRTFATNNRGRHSKDGYDFCSTTHCQRFTASGVGSPTVREGWEADQALTGDRATDAMMAAVRSTEGQILLNDRGRVADVYFSASCGGETANMGTLWGTNPPAYLRGVRDEFCVNGPHAHWTDAIPRADLLRALQSDARTDVGSRLDNVVVNRRDETGRAEFITIEGEHRKTVRGWDFKIVVGRVLGWNLLKSSRFAVARSGANFMFRGSGFGHGLGLCQEGAHVMAQGGASYRRILEKYFPGTRLSRDEETRGNGDAVSRGEAVRSLSLIGRFKADLLLSAQITPRVPISPRPRVAVSSLPRVSSSPRPRFSVLSSEHFRVTYPADVDRRDANLVLTTLESSRADFLRRANAASIAISGIPTLEIRLNQSTGDFTARTGQPWWAAAATKGNRIELQPVAILKRRGVLTTTLRHELAHVMIDIVSRERAPRWLEEGFAIYLAGEGRMFSRYQKRGALLTEELEKKLARPGSQQEMRALYAQAYTSVLELVRNGSETGVWKKIAAS